MYLESDPRADGKGINTRGRRFPLYLLCSRMLWFHSLLQIGLVDILVTTKLASYYFNTLI